MISPRLAAESIPAKWLSGFLVAVSASIVGWILWLCQFGIDLTDEGFYLNWISNPFLYPASSTQFGFVYHPLYLLVDGSVMLLRQVNFIITYALASWLMWAVIGLTSNEGVRIDGQTCLASALSLGTAGALSLVFAGLWLPTPSYNTLALQGLLIAAIGLTMLASSENRNRALAAAALIGVGGWLAFMGKPTTAAVLAVLVGGFLLLTLRLRPAELVVMILVAGALMLLSAILIDGSVAGFIHRIRENLRIGEVLVGGDTYAVGSLIRLEELRASEHGLDRIFPIAWSTILASLFIVLVPARRLVNARLVMALVVAGPLLFLLITPSAVFSVAGSRRSLLFCAVPLAFALSVLIFGIKGLLQVRWAHLCSAFALLLMPYAYAFGTGNEYWIPIAAAGVFALAGVVPFLGLLRDDRRATASLLVLGLAVQVLVFILVHAGSLTPYRQPWPLVQNRSELILEPHKARLILAQPHASYIESVRGVLFDAGYRAGAPMIDLTGHSPGLLYAVGAASIATAWTLGGYPGSDRSLAENLRGVPCEELVKAWLLTEPRGPRSLSASVLGTFGADLLDDYNLKGTIISPDGQHQEILAPLDASLGGVLEKCKKVRAAA